jgi:O-antigen/teichoic acid export membrane protein
MLVAFGAIQAAQLGALSGLEAYHRIARLNFWTACVNFMCLTGGCLFGGLTGGVAGLVVGMAVACLFSRRVLKGEAAQSRIPIPAHGCMAEKSVLWRFSLPAAMASLLVTPTLWYGQTLLVQQEGGYQSMAEFALGTQWRGFVQYLPGLVCAAYLPVAASVPIGDVRQRRKLMLSALFVATAFTGSIAVLIFLASPWILRAYGAGFANAGWVLAIMLLTGVFDAANNILFQTLMAVDRAWYRLASNAVWAMVLVALSLALVPRYLAVGLAGALCLAQATHLCLQIQLALRAIRSGQ